MAADRLGGTNTTEYKVFRSNYYELTNRIQDVLSKFAAKAYQEELITPDHLSLAKNQSAQPFDRASNLLDVLHRSIELKKDNFYKILEVLSSIGGELKVLADRLREQCGPAPQEPAKEETDSPQLLTRPTLKDVYTELQPISAKWRNVGVFLGQSKEALDVVECDYSGAANRMLGMLGEWLNGVDNVTWKAIIEAVGKVDGNRARDIKINR